MSVIKASVCLQTFDAVPHLTHFLSVCPPTWADDTSMEEGGFRWTLSVFYSKSLTGGPAPAFPWSLNVHWCVVLLEIYVWEGRCDLRGCDNVSAVGQERWSPALCVCVSGELDFTCSLSRKLTNLRHIRWVRVTQHTVKRQTASKTCH